MRIKIGPYILAFTLMIFSFFVEEVSMASKERKGAAGNTGYLRTKFSGNLLLVGSIVELGKARV